MVLPNFSTKLIELYNLPYYWGALGLEETKQILSKEKSGSYLLRDSLNGSLAVSTFWNGRLIDREIALCHHMSMIQHPRFSIPIYNYKMQICQVEGDYSFQVSNHWYDWYEYPVMRIEKRPIYFVTTNPSHYQGPNQMRPGFNKKFRNSLCGEISHSRFEALHRYKST